MKSEIPYLKNVKALPLYKLFVEFEDGVNGEIDLSYLTGKGVFSYWNDEQNFKRLKITAHKKIEWNDDIDMDPDAFYLKLINKSYIEYAGN